MAKYYWFICILLMAVSCQEDPDLNKTETLFFEDFENKDNLDDWNIYINILGHETAYLETVSNGNGIGKYLNVISYKMSEMGQTAYDIGCATKYLSSIQGSGIYTLNLKMLDNDDGYASIKLEQIRFKQILNSKELSFCCSSEWQDCSIVDTLDILASDTVAIVLQKGCGFMVGEKPAKFDAIELNRKNL